MKFEEIVAWIKKRQRSFLLIVAALGLAVLVALLATISTNQDSIPKVFAINLLTELMGALMIAIVAGVVYEKLFSKTIVEQIKFRQEKPKSRVGQIVYQLDEITAEISRSKARMIELLDEGNSISNVRKMELHEILERIPVLIEEAENLHFEYLAEIGKDVPSLKIQKDQYLRKKDQAEKFLSAGFLLESAQHKREYSRVLSTLNRWARDYPEINLYVAQLRAQVGNYPKAIDSLRKVINNEQAYKYCIDQGQGQTISNLYQQYQLQLETAN